MMYRQHCLFVCTQMQQKIKNEKKNKQKQLTEQKKSENNNKINNIRKVNTYTHTPNKMVNYFYCNIFLGP